MFRWLVRFSAAALVGALLIWFWNRYNQDLLEEELEEEIPFEFDVAAEEGRQGVFCEDGCQGGH